MAKFVTIVNPRGGFKINKFFKIRISILSALFIFFSTVAFAQSGFDFYFFGQNIKTLQNSNWLKVAAGAVASVCIHELGHALYLESIGKSWDFKASIPSGFAIHTEDNLADGQWRNFGRTGFALQSLIGAGLTFFEGTKYSDFTKGWVTMNAVQVFSYKGRRHDNGDDFELIERGGGNSDLELAAFSVLSFNNLIRLENDSLTLLTKSEAALDYNFLYNFSESEDVSNDVLVLNAGSRQSIVITSALELPLLHPQKISTEGSSLRGNSKFAEWDTNKFDRYATAY